MLFPRSRRHQLARLGVSLVAAGAMLAAVPSAASAQDDPAYIEAWLNDATIGAPDAPGKYLPVEFNLYKTVGPAATFDISGLSGVADAEFPDYCQVASTTVTCDIGFVAGEDRWWVLPLRVVAHPGAAAGDSGRISWVATADNARANPGSATITLGDGPDLVVTSGDEDFGLVPPGQTVAVPIEGYNAGNQPVSGLQLFVAVSASEPGQYDNCAYTTYPEDSYAVCDIDLELAPGEGFEIVGGFEATLTETALREYMSYTVLPAGEMTLSSRAKLTGGTGATLSAVATGGRMASRSTGDLDENDNFGLVLLMADNQADLAVTGASADGAVGDSVQVTVGATNLGPATMTRRSGDPAVHFTFHTPEGTEVTEVPEGCFTVGEHGYPIGSEPGQPWYACASAHWRSPAGDEFEYTFTLLINEVIPDAEGLVQVADYDGSPEPWYDRNLDNNEALVLINPTGEHPGNGGVGGGGAGGGLPVTGAQAGLVAAGGAAILIAGVVFFVLGRRKRVVLVTGDDETGPAK